MKIYFKKLMYDEAHGVVAGLLKIILSLAAVCYGLILGGTKGLYVIGLLPRRKLSLPVISVGNLTLGGVGKTPLVEWIAAELQAKNLKPAILIRGYMDGSSQGIEGQSDEARQLSESLPGVPVIIGANRYQKAKQFLENKKTDVFILDDGFQHWPLKRDLDILAINTANPWGNGSLMPRGILREHLSSIKRSDMIVLTKSDTDAQKKTEVIGYLKKHYPNKDIVETIHAPVSVSRLRSKEEVPRDFLKDKKIAVFSSIGDPDSFQHMLGSLGAELIVVKSFIDHYAYQAVDIKKIVSDCLNNRIKYVVTTAKDAVKLGSLLDEFGGIEPLVLNIKIEITHGKELLLKRIFAVSQR